jgi:hypothetical protein
MGEDSPNDRRRAERVPVNAQFAGVGGKTRYVSDLSEYGVFVHADEGLPVGSVVDLQFTIVLDDAVLLRGRGRIVRRQKSPPGMGIEFMDLDPEMILRINDVVTRQRPRDSGPPLGDATDEAAQTLIKASDKIRAEGLRLLPLPGESEENDPESATTLVNLKKVNVQILDEDDEKSEDEA